jgi:hypothetical protein
MKISRAFLFGMIATVSLTSGCACCDNPCWGFRLHPFQHCAGCGAPASAPVVYRPPSVVTAGPDCPSCGGGVMMPPPASYASPNPVGMSYTPVIGNPMPLPSAPNFMGHDSVVPSPMPGK